MSTAAEFPPKPKEGSGGAGHDVYRRRCRALPGWTGGDARLSTLCECSPQAVAVVFRRYFLALPVHAGGAFVVDLHAIHAYVPLPCFWIARDHARQRNEASAVFGPALEDGEIEQREIVALDHFFARARGDGLRKELAHLGEHGQHLYFVEETLRGLHVHEAANAFGHFVERIDFER